MWQTFPWWGEDSKVPKILRAMTSGDKLAPGRCAHGGKVKGEVPDKVRSNQDLKDGEGLIKMTASHNSCEGGGRLQQSRCPSVKTRVMTARALVSPC